MFLAFISSIPNLVKKSGLLICILVGNLLCTAGSIASGKLVATITIMSSQVSKPSNCANRVLTPDSLSLLFDSPVLVLAIASNSSINIIAGACSLASLNNVSIFLEVVPTYLSAWSPLQANNGISNSLLIALTNKVFPDPLAPLNIILFKVLCTPISLYFSEFLNKSIASNISSLVSSNPAISAKVTLLGLT